MPVLTRKLGETIELGGGVLVTVVGVGRKEVRFRVPAGISVRRSTRRPSQAGRSNGTLVPVGGTVVVGEAVRLVVKKIEDPGRVGFPRVAHITVEGRWPPPTPEPVPRPVSPVRPIDELTPEELARAVGWAPLGEKGPTRRPKQTR